MSAPMRSRMSRREAIAILAAGAAVLACGRAPRQAGPAPIAIGRDECAWCRMPIDDPRQAAQFVPVHGTAALFGEVGCLLAWRSDNADAAGTAFVSVAATGAWLEAGRAAYAVGVTRTPMSFNITAHQQPPADVPAGSIVRWATLLPQGAPIARPG